MQNPTHHVSVASLDHPTGGATGVEKGPPRQRRLHGKVVLALQLHPLSTGIDLGRRCASQVGRPRSVHSFRGQTQDIHVLLIATRTWIVPASCGIPWYS